MAASVQRIHFGGDYNPEQWPPDVWEEDVALMRRAGVDLVSLGIFSWARLEPRPGEYELGWLDRVMDLLEAGGVGVDLATATASPPPWMAARHPETLPVDADGATLWPGSRQAYCPSSPVFREHAARLVEQLAGRYAGHPALRMWHVGNEYACHITCCWCETSAAAFRAWLRQRYGDVQTLNEAWATSFWSQHYGSFEEVQPPRRTPTFGNPTQRLDFRRFSSDEHLACYVAERDVVRRHSDLPVTTNFMVHKDVVDYWAWAEQVDLVSNDHYLQAENPLNHVDLALSADITRGLAGGEPWVLMEHSTSAVNWQPRNVAKRPGEMIRNSLAHVARGADGVLFFQWRQSRAGAEKYHSALVPHAGTDSRVWREVEELGRVLQRLEPVLGSRVQADVAMVMDWQAEWVCGGEATPSAEVRYRDMAAELHRELFARGLTVDVVRPGADLSGYRLVLVPTLTMVTDAAAEVLESYVRAGGHALVTYFSGIVDEHDHVRLGGYPGAFRELLGVRAEEFCPLPADGAVRLVAEDGTEVGTGRVWTEDLRLEGAKAVLSCADGPAPDAPALTRNGVGSGVAWYLATRTEGPATGAVLDQVLETAGVTPALPVPAGVETVVRRSDTGRTFTFLINHGEDDALLPVPGTDLVTGHTGDSAAVPAGGVAVVDSGPA